MSIRIINTRTNTNNTFLSIVKNIKPNSTGCYIWPGRKNGSGYGVYKIQAKQVLVHRLIWKIYNGSISNGFCIMHKCDIRPCINIKHLTIGTWDENNKDRARKGRSALGEKSGRAKLTEIEVRKIRYFYLQKKYTLRELAKVFNVSGHQIFMVGSKKSWRHLV